jgi:multiple antibiotic resistance protein
VVTPYGIALVISLLAASGGGARTVTILGILVLVMLLNLLAMVYAKQIMAGPMVLVLQVFGAVLAVLQVALATEFILWGLSSMGVPPNWHPGEATMPRP